MKIVQAEAAKHFQLTFYVNYIIHIFAINSDKTIFVILKLSC